MATPSLSYDPPTDREMYEGTMAAKAAARRPVEERFVTYFLTNGKQGMEEGAGGWGGGKDEFM